MSEVLREESVKPLIRAEPEAGSISEWPVTREQSGTGAAKVPGDSGIAVFRPAGPNRLIKPIYLQS